MIRASERHEDGARGGLAADDDGDVARSLVEKAQEARILEEPGGRVDEQQLGILLAGEPGEIRARGERRERRGAHKRAAAHEPIAVVA